MPEVSKKGASKELIDGFSDALNSLTEVAQTKDKNKTMLAVNKLYATMPDIYSLYQTKVSPGLKLITYTTREVVKEKNSDLVEKILRLQSKDLIQKQFNLHRP